MKSFLIVCDLVLTSRNSVHNAVDGISKVLVGCSKQASNTQYTKCVLVVKTECCVVYQASLKLHEAFKASEIIQHFLAVIWSRVG